MKRTATTQAKPRIAPQAVYRMAMEGAVLIALERTLFVRNDGNLASCTAVVHNGEARLRFTALQPGNRRKQLALRLLGLR